MTLEEGIFRGLKPAFVQWYSPLEQADVPEIFTYKIMQNTVSKYFCMVISQRGLLMNISDLGTFLGARNVLADFFG